MEVKMADLPGAGKKISFQTAEKRKVVLITHHSGKRDLYFFQDTDEDEADYFLTLTSDETREMGAQLVMEWIKLTAESQIRTHTGAAGTNEQIQRFDAMAKGKSLEEVN